ncbi:hypothetical protein BGZ95_003481 [Linnemannia exigua]|uniref:WD40 repeat-like protein n=1 Tax=Linnemannia exigua TaxID=604196 RepID=A0AAD4DNS0_9FUNG|nr:hypothetical protein BGZ95_003481 [Linnemannia exigua]
MTSSLSPPPRKQSVSSPQRSASTRYPKINTNALAAHASIKEDDQDVEKDLANFFASSSLNSASSLTSSSSTPVNRGYHSRPLSIATVYSPIDPSDASCSSRTSPQPCHHHHHHQLHHHNDLDSNQHVGFEQDMAMAGPLLPPCSYCSSVRSNSISSIIDDTHNQVRDRNSTYQYYEQQRQSVLRDLVPSEVRHRLTFHLDECWFVHFSPSGEYLASIGLDQSIILWRDLMCPEPSIYKTLTFDRSITRATWSPNSKYLLINLGYNHYCPDTIYKVQVVDVESGETVFTKSREDNTMTADISWFSDSERFLTVEDSGKLSIMNIKGETLKEYMVNRKESVMHVRNITGTDDFAVLTSSCRLEVHSFDGDTHTVRTLGANIDQGTALTVSEQGRYAAVTVRDDKAMHRPAHIEVYDLKTMAYLRSFEAETHYSYSFMIIPSFVGPNEEILSAGSENGKLHFWDVETGELITVLEEHSKHSGCITTNLAQPGMIASSSDDNHIIVWVTKELQNELQESDDKWMEERRKLARPAFDIKKGW